MTEGGLDNVGAVSRSLPSFNNPPVVEVALGLTFDPLPLGAVDLARLYDRWREIYPSVEEHPAIVSAPGPGLFMDTGLPSMRLLMLGPGGQIAQVQRDRLVVNWRKESEDSEYPRFGMLREQLQERLSDFTKFVRENYGVEVRIRATEVTYVNSIEFPSGSAQLLSEVFTILNQAPSQLGKATDTSFFLQFDTSESTGFSDSRLIVNAQRDTGKETPLLILQLSAYMQAEDVDRAFHALDRGRESIVLSFRDMTRPAMHDSWELIK